MQASRMPSCIVQGCTSSSKTKDPAPVLHAFPPEVENVRTWLLQTKQDFGNLEEFSKKIAEAPRGSYRMCSLHFGKECYEIRGRSFFLKKGAVPTLFTPRKASGDMMNNEELCPSLKRSKRGANLTLTEADITAKEHNYAGTLQTPVPDMSSSSQAFGTSNIVSAAAVEVDIKPDSSTIIPFEDTLPRFAKRKKVRLPQPSKVLSRLTDYGRQMHRSTNTDPYFGKTHRKISVNVRPRHFSIGIQCNLANLPALQDHMTQSQTVPSIDTLALSSRKIRKMVLHRGRVFVDLGEDDDF